MRSENVTVGQFVSTGDQLGEVGDTGYTTGPHLHFEIRIGKNTYFHTRNPELWVAPSQGWGVLAGRIMDSSRKAMHQALRQATNAGHQAADSIGKVLKELDRSGVTVDNHATVTVQSSGQAVKSFVKTDDTGAIILVSNPKLHLTAHDPSGKLLFDGEIETPDQRARVPRDLWERVEPLLEKMAAHAEPKP